MHSVRMDSISDFVQEARKTSAENAENIKNLLVGIENLGENVKQLREEMRGWEEPELQEATEKVEQELMDLMEEVPVSAPAAPEQSHPVVQPVSEPISIFTPPASAPVLNPPTSQSNFVYTNEDLQNDQRRLAALRFGQTESMVEVQALKKPYLGVSISTPVSNEVPVMTHATEGPPQQITPLQVRSIPTDAEILQSFRQRDAAQKKMILERIEKQKKEKMMRPDVGVVDEKCVKTKKQLRTRVKLQMHDLVGHPSPPLVRPPFPRMRDNGSGTKYEK